MHKTVIIRTHSVEEINGTQITCLARFMEATDYVAKAYYDGKGRMMSFESTHQKIDHLATGSKPEEA